MARTKRSKGKATGALKQENDELRRLVTTQALAQQAMLGQLHASAPSPLLGSQPMVGIRNVSDYTIGLKSPLKGEPDIQLHSDAGVESPDRVAVISWAWWQQLRKLPHVGNGMIIRDDTLLGDNYLKGPADKPSELAANHEKNVVLDPHAWITSRSEQQIREGIAAMTSQQTLRRLRRAVDDKLRELQAHAPVTDPNRALSALQNLPSSYNLVDQLTTLRLEAE